jgi:hypothetical protein
VRPGDKTEQKQQGREDEPDDDQPVFNGVAHRVRCGRT